GTEEKEPGLVPEHWRQDGYTRFRSWIAVRCFFFHAEDGIRDFHVTGVQTCALPICVGDTVEIRLTNADDSTQPHSIDLHAVNGQIGRASCRERVVISPGSVASQKIRLGF